MPQFRSVFTIGFDRGPRWTSLSDALAACGFPTVDVPAAEELASAVPAKRPAAILVYHSPEAYTAREVLRIVEDAGWRTPVIVIVEHGEFEDYYELMCRGAYDYFDLSGGVEAIVRSLRGAAYGHAA